MLRIACWMLKPLRVDGHQGFQAINIGGLETHPAYNSGESSWRRSPWNSRMSR